MIQARPVRTQIAYNPVGVLIAVNVMRSVPGAVATGSQPSENIVCQDITRSLPLPVLTSSSNKTRLQSGGDNFGKALRFATSTFADIFILPLFDSEEGMVDDFNLAAYAWDASGVRPDTIAAANGNWQDRRSGFQSDSHRPRFEPAQRSVGIASSALGKHHDRAAIAQPLE